MQASSFPSTSVYSPEQLMEDLNNTNGLRANYNLQQNSGISVFTGFLNIFLKNFHLPLPFPSCFQNCDWEGTDTEIIPQEFFADLKDS